MTRLRKWWRTWQAAISLGEPQAGRDPGMPEWGNPGDECRLSVTESIGDVKPTRGSETSQYLQEKTSTEIPLVAASEWGGAQTGEIRFSGVVGPQCGITEDSGTVWKVRQYRVTAPYTKSKMNLEASRVARPTWKVGWIWEDHLPRLNTFCQPIVY